MMHFGTMIRRAVIAGLFLVVTGQGAFAAEEKMERAVRKPAASQGDLEAGRLCDKARELLANKETERAIKMFESVLDQYPQSHARFLAALALGRYYMEQREQLKAIGYLNVLKDLDHSEEPLSPEDRELYLEAMYLTGMGYFQARQFASAFPILRKITANYANTVWANQAYYYIGMCHFAMQNWSKAIEALNMVGTFIDPDSPTIQYMEAGRRLYIKISDGDLPILQGMGKRTFVEARTAKGDREKIETVPLPGQEDVFIGSLPTAIGLPIPDDTTIQLIGGDQITVRYIDLNTEDGKTNVLREYTVKAVSSAGLEFVLGDQASRAAAIFIGQPVFVVMNDLDHDTSDAADIVEVTVISRYKEDDADENVALGAGVSDRRIADEGPRLVTRDTLTLRLTEQGTSPVRSGRFSSSFPVIDVTPDKPPLSNDEVLTCRVGDEVVVTCEDNLSINGETRRVIERVLPVIGEIDNVPKVTQSVVTDPVVKARKNVVEGTAYLELARIFQSMGLSKGAKEKAAEGLARVDEIIRTAAALPVAVRQEAYKLKWELHLAANDLELALATCAMFNRLYPNSPMIDQALMGIADVRLENKQYPDAIKVYRQVLALPKSDAKAKAQFKIAEITESTKQGTLEAAIPLYKVCAEKYPDSEYAGLALAKVIDYYMKTKDYAQANTLLEQVFQDFPDAKFLDTMYLKAVQVAYFSGDFARAAERCSQLLFQYPDSPVAATAKQLLPKIQSKIKTDDEKAVTDAK